MRRDDLGEDSAAINRAVVGHDTLDNDAMRPEPGDGGVEEGHGALLLLVGLLVGNHGGEGQPGGVVDGDVEVFPAAAALAALATAITGDAMVHTVDAAELLDVDVDQLAGMLALIADDPGFGVQRLEAVEAEAARHQPDGGASKAEFAGDGGAEPALAARRLDLGGGLGWQAPRVVKRPGGSVAQPMGAATAPTD
jgi:hypothetical protein